MKALCSPIVDLRQYTLYPGTRDRFVELFDSEFVESQEAVGMRVIGQFRDLGDPNRFVWMRGFADMPARAQALTSFYEKGEAWAEYAESARSMMIDSSDALLLCPAAADSSFRLDDPALRPAFDSEAPGSLVVATIHHFVEPIDADFLSFYDDSVVPVLRAAGGHILGKFTTQYSPNNFPRLPVRTGENVFVVFCGFATMADYHEHMTALGRNQTWRGRTGSGMTAGIYPRLTGRLLMPPQTLRLAPTTRSQLRG